MKIPKELESQILAMAEDRHAPIRPTPIRRPPKPSTKITPVMWRAFGIPEPTSEFRFAPPRRWRFDYCWEYHAIALEIDGGVYSGGRHTRGSGFIKDQEKTNAAATLGWLVLRCTPADVKSGAIFATIRKALKLETP